VVGFGPKIGVKIYVSDAAGQYLEEVQKAFSKIDIRARRCSKGQHQQTPTCDKCSSARSDWYRCEEVRLSTYGRRAFAVAGPTVWNSLPEDMRDLDVSEDSIQTVTEDVFIFAVLVCSAH